MFKPKLITTLRDYSVQAFLSDLAAGTIVGVVALPLAIAFAIASGVSPEKGLVTAVVAGFLISALGGSRVQIGGPTGAFVVIIYGIIAAHGIDGLAVATVMAGLILVVMGLARLGSVIRFIPHPVIVGFTSGIAVIIFSSQIKDLLGLRMGEVPPEFFDKWLAYAAQIATINPQAVAVAMVSMGIILIVPRWSRRIPGALVALVVATAGVQLFSLDIETIGSRFGSIPATLALPSLPSLPSVDFATIKILIGPAMTIAILAAIESLLSAVVADGMIGGKHRPNTELIAQGIANIASPLFGGIPATGAIARTATNIRNGGRTPVAGMIHALVLLLIMVVFGRWATLIPLSCLAAILVVVAYNMSEWRSFRALLKSPRSDVAILVLTFLLTVILDLTVAIGVGFTLSLLLFMRRMSNVTSVEATVIDDDEDGGDAIEDVSERGIEVFEINGPLFYGAVYKFEEAMSVVEAPAPVTVLRMRHVPAIDATGLHALEDVQKRISRRGGTFILAEIHAQPLIAVERAGLIATFGEANIHADLESAMRRAREVLGQ